MKTIYDRIHSAASGEGKDKFVRCEIDLKSMHEPRPLMPPTYITNKKDSFGKEIVDHHYDSWWLNGKLVRVCIVDAIQSQARRQQIAAGEAFYNGELKIPMIEIDVGKYGKLPITELPHKIADSILLQSTLDGKPFANHPYAVAICSGNYEEAVKTVLGLSPFSLLYGVWASSPFFTNKIKALKLTRMMVSDIIAEVDNEGHCYKSQSRIDPLNPAGTKIYVNPDNPVEWSLEEKKKYKPKKISEVGLSSIPPSVKELGISPKWIKHTYTFNLVRLSSYYTGRENRKADVSARAMLGCLGLVCHVLGTQNMNLRSGCDLIRKEEKPNVYKFNNTDNDTFELTKETALQLYNYSLQMLPEGVNYDANMKPLVLKVPKQYLDLLDNSSDGEDDE